jgi:UDP-glucose 4-epimerase
MTRVLVTGGAGFIGSHIADALLAAGREVVVVDDFSSGHRKNIPKAAHFIEGDLSEPGVAEAAVDGCDSVVHCAAMPSVALSVEDPMASHRANLGASTRLLLAARDAGVRRIVYSSTSAVYGGEVDGAADETLREAPMSPYGLNKLAAEHLFRMSPKLFGVDTVCLRYFNIFGPRQDPNSPYSGVISIFVTHALEGRCPMIHGDGKQSRDFTYVGDVVKANLLGLDLERGEGRVMNIGWGRSTDLLTIWGHISKACGQPELEPTYGPPRAGDIRHSMARTEVARQVLGFEPSVSLEVGLGETVAWYRSAPPVAR